MGWDNFGSVAGPLVQVHWYALVVVYVFLGDRDWEKRENNVFVSRDDNQLIGWNKTTLLPLYKLFLPCSLQCFLFINYDTIHLRPFWSAGIFFLSYVFPVKLNWFLWNSYMIYVKFPRSCKTYKVIRAARMSPAILSPPIQFPTIQS